MGKKAGQPALSATVSAFCHFTKETKGGEGFGGSQSQGCRLTPLRPASLARDDSAGGGAKTFRKRDPKDTVQGVGRKRFGNGTQKTRCRGWGKNVLETGPKRHGARGGAKTFRKRDPKDTVQGVGQKRFGNGTQKTRCKGWGENVSETGPEKFSGQGTINRRRRASYLARGVWQRRLSCGSDRPD
jgi:hypothetical protein